MTRISPLQTYMFALFLALCLVTQPRSALAQQQQPPNQKGITLDVQAGYDGHYRQQQWLPITIIASNDGPDIRGTIEWRFINDTRRFRRDVELPRGARKRITLYAVAQNFMRTGEIRLFHGNKQVYQQQAQVTPIAPDQFVVGVLSSDKTLLNSLSAMVMDNTSGTIVLHLQPDMLPDYARVFDTLDVLFIHDSATQNLSAAQQAALRLWVRLGGQLVVSGGASADQSTPGLEDILPVTIQGLQKDVSLASLQRLVHTFPGQQNTTFPPNTTVSVVDVHDDVHALVNDNLLTEHSYGSGRVIFSAFDLSALRIWSGESELWSNVLESKPRFAPALEFWRRGNILYDILEVSSLYLLSFWVLVLFVFSYIVIVGPLNFLLLRRIRHAELAWITTPMIVVLFVVGTYGTGFLMRGTHPKLYQMTIAQSSEGHSYGQATAYTGVFSPRRKSYTIAFPEQTLVRPAIRDSESESNAPIVAWADQATEVRNVLIDVSEMRTFTAEKAMEMSVNMQSNLTYDQQRIQGEVENVGTLSLADAILVRGNVAQELGTLAPGDTVSIDMEVHDQFDSWDAFPDAITTPNLGVFNRRDALMVLFSWNQSLFTIHPNQDAFVSGMPETEGVYLLGWSEPEQPLIEVQVNNRSIEQQSIVLHVIRLKNVEQS